MTTYYEASQLTRSQKVTLVSCEAVERVKLFTANGANWDRVVSHFVVGVKDNGTVITSWTYNPLTNILQITGGANPKTRNLSLTYRFFFSNMPVHLPYDLSTGVHVEWVPSINTVGSIGQQLDEENTGIVLESSSNIDFLNHDAYFDDLFDKLLWENQAVKIYSWFPVTHVSEKLQLFDGIIESKSFSETKVSFKVKDFVFRLKNKVDLGVYTEADGTLLPSYLGKAKRRIYGQADYVKCISLDATLDGYAVTGLLNATLGTNALTGTSSAFLGELSPGDELILAINGETQKIAIESIQSDTSLTMGKVIEFSIVNLSAINTPKLPSRYKNRAWQIAGHKLRNPSTTITTVKAINRFIVSDVSDFFAGDEIIVNGIQATIRRISGMEIVTESAISPIPVVTNVIEKRPISAVYFGAKKLIYSRDYSIVNTSTAAKIALNNLAEFNIAEQVGLSTSLVFTNGSRSITTSAAVDLRTILKPRDWIRSNSLSEPSFYEILDVTEQGIALRTNFLGLSGTKASYYKAFDYIDENSLITVNCMGMERSGVWIKTASDAVRDLIINDAGFGVVNETAFSKAKSDCNYILSMVIPDSVDGNYPEIREVITKINESVFGSLYGDSTQNISYSIFNANRNESMPSIKDDDILSFTVQTNQNIINQAKINYRPYVDIFAESDAFKTVIYHSGFVDKYIGIENSLEQTVYLYEDDKVLIVAQRMCFFKSLSSSILTIKAKLNLAQYTVNDKVYLSLDRLFKRYSGSEKKRVGIVSGVKRDGFNCEITVSDLGNIYNRTMSIAPNSTPTYSLSAGDEIIHWGYIVDNSTETPNVTSETGLGSYLIG